MDIFCSIENGRPNDRNLQVDMVNWKHKGGKREVVFLKHSLPSSWESYEKKLKQRLILWDFSENRSFNLWKEGKNLKVHEPTLNLIYVKKLD